jgi:ketosteroid isomerase-like protein
MDAQTFKTAVEDLIAKVIGGKSLEAFDRYYADDVTMQENEQTPRIGKAACRTFEEDFLSKIKAVRTYVCDGYVISGNKAFIVYRIDADHADCKTSSRHIFTLVSGASRCWYAVMQAKEQNCMPQ